MSTDTGQLVEALSVNGETFDRTPPFKEWESDHTALVHVLWFAHHQGLTLADDFDEVARLIRHSRYDAARAAEVAR